MNSKAAISGVIGLVLVIAMIALVIWINPVRHFEGSWLLFPVVLVVAGISAFAMRGRGRKR